MQFLNSLFGGSDNLWLTVAFALGVVIVLIVLGVWLLKLLSSATSRAGRGRIRRLAIIDSLVIGPRRQLLIVRRDNVEHLILTGGASDLVVESGIPVEEARPARRPIKGQPASQPASQALAQPAQRPGEISALDRLRELNKPGAPRRAVPRHPGLMRPVSQMERGGLAPEVQISAIDPRDSAKESDHETGGGRTGFDEIGAKAVRRAVERK